MNQPLITCDEWERQQYNRNREVISLGEQKRQQAINFWADYIIKNKADAAEVLQKSKEMIEEGWTVDEAKSFFCEMLKNTKQQPLSSPLGEQAMLGMNRKETQEYSLCRALAAACQVIKPDDLRIEKDVHQELMRKLPKDKQNGIGGLLIPHDIFIGSRMRSTNPYHRNWVENRATYAVGSDPTGGYTVGENLLADNFVEALRPKSLSMQMGIQTLSGLREDQSIPTRESVANTYWIGEDEALTQSESTFGKIPLTPKTFGMLSKYTRNMLLQGTPDIEQLIRRDFADGMAVGLDAAILAGTGLNNQPVGILNHASVQNYQVSEADGRGLTYDDLLEMEYLSGSANALNQSMAWMGNAAIRKSLKKTPIQPNGVEGNFIWQSLPDNSNLDPSCFGRCLDYLIGITENIPSDFTKGSETGLNGLIFGDWSNIILGEWGILEIMSNPYSEEDFSKGNVSIRAFQSIDIGIRNPESFVKCTEFVKN